MGDGRLIATVDALVEGVHFFPDDPVESVARKLVRTNVSDIIAKGARPLEALLTLGWPHGRPEEDLARFAGPQVMREQDLEASLRFTQIGFSELASQERFLIDQYRRLLEDLREAGLDRG